MKLYTTSYINKKRETSVIDFSWSEKTDNNEMQVVNIYADIEYQKILGFGGAITEAAGYTFSLLSEENKKNIIEDYFGESGNNYSMVRSHMDSCDFSLNTYSAMEDPDDIKLDSFNLSRDEQYILPLLKAAQSMRKEPLDIMLSPWSPPAFMKTNGDRKHGGKLKPEYRQLWAEYICKYIKEYHKRGFKVNRITVQNEPDAVQVWDSCIFTAEEEKEFLRDYLHPALVKNGLEDVKINIWDHNKERMFERAIATIDVDTDKMIDGIGFHWYTGDHFEAVALTKEHFPNKELIFTEGCVEYSRFSPDQLQNAQMYAHDMIGNLNAGMTGFLDWNIILNEDGGPNHVGNHCDAPVMCDTKNDKVVKNLSFYYIGHFSRYIQKGAKRIAFTKYTDLLEMTAFKNPNGEIVVVLLNRTEQDIPVTLRMNGKAISLTILRNTISTGIIEKNVCY